MITADRERLISLMTEQAEIGGTEAGGLNRLALTEEDRIARDWFRDLMENTGLEVRVDSIGNMFGRRPGTDPDTSPVLLGSHLDSQPYGGRFDGPLGLLGALELVHVLVVLGHVVCTRSEEFRVELVELPDFLTAAKRALSGRLEYRVVGEQVNDIVNSRVGPCLDAA